MERPCFRDFCLSFLMTPYVLMQNTLFRSSSFRLCYNSCRRHCPRRKPLHAVTHKILAGETYVDEKKMPSLRSLHLSIFLMRRETGKPEGNLRFRLALKLDLQIIVGMRAVTDSHCASVTRAIFKVKTEKKTKYTLYTLYMFTLYML